MIMLKCETDVGYFENLTTEDIVSHLIERLEKPKGIIFLEDKPRLKIIKLLSMCDCDEPEGLSPEPVCSACGEFYNGSFCEECGFDNEM